MPELPDWEALTIEEAASQTGYHPESLRRLCRGDNPTLVSVKVGQVILIKKESLDKYIEDSRRKSDAWRFGPRKGR